MIFAGEDVSNADPRALPLAVAAAQAHEMTGLPESRIILAHAVTYLASAAKSNASYLGLKAATDAIRSHGAQPVPIALRNPDSAISRNLKWGEAYRNPHRAGGFETADYLPDALHGKQFYQPTENGYEGRLKERLALWRSLRAGHESEDAPASETS